MTEDLWVLCPAGRRRDGSWIDDTLTDRDGGRRAPDVGRFPRQRVELFRGPDAASRVEEVFRRRGWTDGLPVAAPTTGRVDRLVRATGRPAGEVLAEVAPLGGIATVEAVAANAVMAGCGTEQIAYVVAAVEAVTDPGFGLVGVQTTDENATPLLVVSAPPDRLAAAQINAGSGVLGPGWRGNATVGRAMRLVLQNLGGGWPDAVSFAGAGQPGRYTLCAAEDEEACPWPPLRLDLGYGEHDAVVVALRAETALNVTGGLVEITSVTSSAASLFTAAHGGSAGLLLAPHLAGRLAAEGLDRSDVADRIRADSRIDADLWRRSWLAGAIGRAGDPEAGPAIADLLVFVAGARLPIPQHVFFPGWGFGDPWTTALVGHR